MKRIFQFTLTILVLAIAALSAQAEGTREAPTRPSAATDLVAPPAAEIPARAKAAKKHHKRRRHKRHIAKARGIPAASPAVGTQT